MRTFDYFNLPRALFERRVGDLNAALHEDKGRLDMIERMGSGQLKHMKEQAHLDNVTASLTLEGLSLPTRRVREIVEQERTLTPKSEEERYFLDELADVEAQVYGFSRGLRRIEEHAAEIELSSATAVELFETLYCNRKFGRKSRYRSKDYMYVQADGHVQAVPVSPVVAFETPLTFGGSCDSLAAAFDADRCSPLILSAVFTVDFLCIRPFEEGNGRIARLMAALLMAQAGFDVFRYESVDALISQDMDEYYRALNECVEGWESGRGDYRPFAEYWFGKIHQAYGRLFDRIEVQMSMPVGKSERVRYCIEHAGGPISKVEILHDNPDISVSTVEVALGQLVHNGIVRKVGKGRATKYIMP